MVGIREKSDLISSCYNNTSNRVPIATAKSAPKTNGTSTGYTNGMSSRTAYLTVPTLSVTDPNSSNTVVLKGKNKFRHKSSDKNSNKLNGTAANNYCFNGYEVQGAAGCCILNGFVNDLDASGLSKFSHHHWRLTAQECNAIFLLKISDDERMSLTTAVSDEEEAAESGHTSPYKSRVGFNTASSFNCTGAVRKAGFLSVKKWLLRKKHQIELARKRGWKGYWVCLKGTTLLFYPCDNRDGRTTADNTPKHLIIVDGSILQPIPEHPKREFIFCLSTAFGDAYLFQAPCQVELDNWVNSIHGACAAAFARHRGKTGTLHLMQEEIQRIDREMESDSKMKHMADLQLTVVSDQENRQHILSQILQWDENLERLHCEQFRLRCYLASLQSTELPNPKNLLSHVCRSTKNSLNRLGVFTVSSFHALICARSPSLLNNLLAGKGATRRRYPTGLLRSNSTGSRRSLSGEGSSSDMLASAGEVQVRVTMPDNQITTVSARDGTIVEEFLAVACSRRQLLLSDHFLRLFKNKDSENYYVPYRADPVDTLLQTFEVVEVCAKILYQVDVCRTSVDQMWGFSVEAELIETSDQNDELCVFVSRVEDRSLAMQQGIIKGDEIMVVNGAIVSDLDMMFMESVLQEELTLCMMLRSCRTEPPDLSSSQPPFRSMDDYIDQLVCPPPPSDMGMSDDLITGLIVPAPWSKISNQHRSTSSLMMGDLAGIPPPPPTINMDNLSSQQIENLLKTAEQVTTEYCRSPVLERRRSFESQGLNRSRSASGGVSPVMAYTHSNTPPPGQPFIPVPRQLSDAEKLRKVILELIETERTYVKHLNVLLENYLEPLKMETFLSNAEINALFGNITEIVTFQRVFLRSLEDSIKDVGKDFYMWEHPAQFKNVLLSLGGSFLYYANHFKLYSSFCASHSKAQKVLHPNEGNQALQDFLVSRNPRQEHSSTLESYLIKPIQRILKYPLLIQQLRNLSRPATEENTHLAEALRGMENVAEHINEMQRIHEEYGAIFDHLHRQHHKASKQHVDLSPGELLYYGGVEWLNISDFLGKIKKGLELHAMCFVFNTAVVFLCKERIRQKKKMIVSSSKSSSNEVEIIRYQVLIPVTEVQVRASSLKDIDSHYMWELIHLRSQIHWRSEKVYVLSNSLPDYRNAFLKTIRQIIRESVRNMSIPANKAMYRLDSNSFGTETLINNNRLLTPNSQMAPPGGSNNIVLSRTLSGKKKPRGQQRYSSGAVKSDTEGIETYDNVDHNFRTRSGHDSADETMFRVSRGVDSGAEGGRHKSRERAESSYGKDRPMLGKTPNHLSLSTTSTLSTGSNASSAAKLIQSSTPPTSYQPPKQAGSPVWKPRGAPGSGDIGKGASPQPPPGQSKNEPLPPGAPVREQFIIYADECSGFNSGAKRKDIQPSRHSDL